MSLWATLTYPFRRGPRRPLAERRPSRRDMGQEHDVPLGMEATDLDLVDRVNRRNSAAERPTSAPTGTPKTTLGRVLESADTRVTPMPEDETYATRFHRIFQKKGS